MEERGKTKMIENDLKVWIRNEIANIREKRDVLREDAKLYYGGKASAFEEVIVVIEEMEKRE